MATIINENTFNGANQGNVEGYIPQTTIESAVMDADMAQILQDLNTHLALLQAAFAKLDLIDPDNIGVPTAEQIVGIINASSLRIDIDNLADDVISLQEFLNLLAAHCVTTVQADMHTETSIKATGLTYSNTPTSLLTICDNLLDELKNIRYQINRMNGKSVWIDTPDSSLSVLKTTATATTATLNSHTGNTVAHTTALESAALHASHSPSAANAFATMADVINSSIGAGDMKKSIYDTNNNGIVDKACALVDGCGNILKTYQDIVSKIASEIATHKANASAHHTRYTNAEAIGAINTDTDHDITAIHRYTNLLNKPPADLFTVTEVTNIRNAKLDDGTTPWTTKAPLVNNLVPAIHIPCIMTMPASWTNEAARVETKAFYSSTTTGQVESIFTGPVILTSGMGFRTSSSAYLQVSVNGGSTWVECLTSPGMLQGPDPQGDDIRVWTLPPMYVPAGKTFRIRAGSSFCGCSTQVFGGGYHIQFA